jgi:hypothetical protein
MVVSLYLRVLRSFSFTRHLAPLKVRWLVRFWAAGSLLCLRIAATATFTATAHPVATPFTFTFGTAQEHHTIPYRL